MILSYSIVLLVVSIPELQIHHFSGMGRHVGLIDVHSEAKSRPSTSDPWDLISEILCIEVNGERKIIFRSRLNCATYYTYVVCQFKR